jgi:hypothetical protein
MATKNKCERKNRQVKVSLTPNEITLLTSIASYFNLSASEFIREGLPDIYNARFKGRFFRSITSALNFVYTKFYTSQPKDEPPKEVNIETIVGNEPTNNDSTNWYELRFQ